MHVLQLSKYLNVFTVFKLGIPDTVLRKYPCSISWLIIKLNNVILLK